LRLDPRHAGAHKGIGFLYFVAGDLPLALEHLAAAQAADPEAEGVAAALARVREALAAREAPAPATPVAAPEAVIEQARAVAAVVELPEPSATDDVVFAGLEGARDGLLLLDGNGLRLGGGLSSPTGAPVGDAVAAHLAGVFRDATRAARLLELGVWKSVAAESGDATFFLSAPTPESLLLLVRDSSVPIGRLAWQAARAAAAARAWLERPA
jgi:predicted regulator of Ras-like GTPase activity (Roadblock/LC7/MglB family)